MSCGKPQEDKHKARGSNREQNQEGSRRMEEESPLPVLAWKPWWGGRKITEECEAGGLGGGGSSNNQSKKTDTMISSHVTE